MATSHYCHGKWRSGSVGSCPRHEKLAKKQTNVYRGVGDPGGRSGSKKADAKKSAPKKTEKSSGTSSSAGS
ncbi:MAG: hypothetical protein KJN63_00765 [Acidimicrobiia bacterium]|nr:hypothetical protein [Acidimicrobiia bacterium]